MREAGNNWLELDYPFLCGGPKAHSLFKYLALISFVRLDLQSNAEESYTKYPSHTPLSHQTLTQRCAPHDPAERN